jgi:hypothetical protein
MPKIYSVLLPFILLFLLSCAKKEQKTEAQQLNYLAENYVRLGLTIGLYDADFVDAYYGPDSLKPAISKSDIFPKDSLLNLVTELRSSLKNSIEKLNDSSKVRARWMSQQLLAFDRRIRIYSGEFKTFDEESKELFGISAPVYPEEHYKLLLDTLNQLLPGKGTVQDRFQNLANRFIIPENKLDTIFKTTIAEARKSTKAYYSLPETETFTIEYVKDKPWSGYNWYKGNYTSLIQINTDTRIFIERAIDVGSHESYPGHHVYNMLLEKNLYQDKGWVEISLYPLFSPQSFIAEGSANYGIDLVFPGDKKIRFAKEKLLPLAGLDTTFIGIYFKSLAIRGKLNYARNEAARGIVNQTMNDQQALDWLMNYCLYNQETALKSISFIKKYRSYVINYNYGQDLVRNYIELNEKDPKKRWEVFGKLLSNPVLPEKLLIK